MSEQKSSTGISIGFFGALTIVFITLKLCSVIDWSWWLVTLPAWGSFVLAVILVVLVTCLEAKQEKKREALAAERRRSGKESKFMKRLQDAIDESEKRKAINEN